MFFVFSQFVLFRSRKQKFSVRARTSRGVSRTAEAPPPPPPTGKYIYSVFSIFWTVRINFYSFSHLAFYERILHHHSSQFDAKISQNQENFLNKVLKNFHPLALRTKIFPAAVAETKKFQAVAANREKGIEIS